MAKIKPATADDVQCVAYALDHLQKARDLLRKAGALRSAQKTRRALKSAEGAYRHVKHRAMRSPVDAEVSERDLREKIEQRLGRNIWSKGS